LKLIFIFGEFRKLKKGFTRQDITRLALQKHKLVENQLRELEHKLDSLPLTPGVYLFKDENGEIIYIGKAKKIRNRIRSYFQKGNKELKSKKIRELATDVEIITTNSEIEALILENNLIKLHKPILNLRLKDDKTYPYLRITISEEIPRVEIVRKRVNSSDYYFGPFSDVKSLRVALKKALTIFPIARCKKKISFNGGSRGCLYAQLGRCLAPCLGTIKVTEYLKTVHQFIKFFEGKHQELLNEMKKEMEEASLKLEFEKAALIRDRVYAIEKTIQNQSIVSKNLQAEYDLLGIAKEKKNVLVQILLLRQGRIIDEKHFLIELPYDLKEGELLETFIKQYYSRTDRIPKSILIKKRIKDEEIINQWLNTLLKKEEEKTPILRLPQNEEEKAFLELAYKNAKNNLQISIQTEKRQRERNREILTKLKQILKLERLPLRIEGYDISTLYGTETVGSCVVFINGDPKKSKYRRFIIEEKNRQSDFDSLREIIRRRFTGSLAQEEDDPDVILIDGGAGQVNGVYEVLKKIHKEIPVFGLSKRFEKIHFPITNKTIKLDEHSAALKLLQRIRNEAHRFAIEFHRQKRRKKMVKLSLEEIEGIGKEKIALLLNHFNNINELKKASLDELVKIKGIRIKIAKKILDFYKKTTDL